MLKLHYNSSLPVNTTVIGMEDLYCNLNTIFFHSLEEKLDHGFVILAKTNFKLTVPADNPH